MVNIYRDNNAANAFLLFIYGLLIKLPYLLHPHIPEAEPTDGFLYHELIQYLQKSGSGFPLIYSFIAFLLLLTQSLTVNRLLNEQRLMSSPTYLVAMAYLLVTSLVPDWNYLSSALIINTVMVWAWPRMVSLYHNPAAKTLLFNIGLGLGISSFFYPSSLLLLVLLIVALLVFRRFNITEWIVALLGVLTPYYFLFVYLFLTDKLHFSALFPALSFSYPKIHFNALFWLRTILLIFPLIVGMYYIQFNTGRMLIQVRKSWALMSFYLVIAFFIPFINPVSTYSYWILCAVPLSAFHAAAYFYPKRFAFANYLHWIMIAFIVAAFFL
ncbi:MAG: hypothetical protein HYX40_07005 [Sphingobacteriales bacterium]|nr:hypothetical protein [Sphingobacteriales bacterium]